ncbi:copper amine oxidase N-terminal domain-containing protein [Brevibacillus humidisoli]|uniref:copper amine oxidase N-terminal domain-containing protein n=1 Tax=Brevibacillus humidisoli TaxID=2895522 RepID=UPI001E3CF57E|nr:copper amine oxidase N-terminal domain-containing protein [Brevibacillus humidisoli]UFJ39413.1 copper amine oxidase N-terminal domain-containing protein [Brevibacillus humidisoli]
MDRGMAWTGRWIALLFLFSALFVVTDSPAIAKQAYESFTVEVDGQVLSYRSDDYYLEGDRTFAQAEKLLAALEAEHSVDLKQKIVIAKKGKITLTMPIGEAYAMRNGKRLALEQEPRIVNANVQIPVRFVSEALGGTVHWYADTRTVIVDTKPKDMGIIDNDLLDAAAKGKVEGIAIRLGQSRKEVEAVCGVAVDSFSYEGGLFYEYPDCRCSVFYDDQERAAVLWIFQSAIGNLNTADAKQILGSPEWEEENQTWAGYLLYYPAGANAITLRASSKHGTIKGFWLREKRS